MIRKCSKCPANAAFIPRLSMFAFTGASPSVMFFDYPVCRLHSKLTPADLVTDETWVKAVIANVEGGKLAPRRDLNTVEAMPIRGPEALAFFDALERGKTMKITAPAAS